MLSVLFPSSWGWCKTQGFNATLTEPVDTPGSRGDQIKEMELKLHPEIKVPLTALCNDPKTTVVVLSGSDSRVLDKVCLALFLSFLSKPSLVLYQNQLIALTELWGV